MAFEGILPDKIVRKTQQALLPAGQQGVADGPVNTQTILRDVIKGLFADNSQASVLANNSLSSLLGNLGNSGVLDPLLAKAKVTTALDPLRPTDGLDTNNGTSVDAPLQTPQAKQQQAAVNKAITSKPATGSYTATNPGANGYQEPTTSYTPNDFKTQYGEDTVSDSVLGLSKIQARTAIGGEEIVSRFGKGNGVGGYRTREQDSIANGDHPHGLALDWGAPTIDQGEAVFKYQIDNASRLGIKYVIFNGKIWNRGSGVSTYRPPPGEGNHSDHVHTSYYG